MSSLFSLLNPSSTAAPAAPSSLLGTASTQPAQSQPATSSLFGATTTQPAQGQPATSNLFSGLGGGSGTTSGGSTLGGYTPQNVGATSSLFRGAAGQQQGGGLGQSSAAQQQPGASALLQQSTQQNGQNHAYFDSILEKSRKRAYGETGGEDLPQLQLGLGDLRQRIKRIGTGAPDRSVDGKAHYLLAASGVDPGSAVRDLNLFSAATGRVDRIPAQQSTDTDVEGYLASLQTQTTLSMISDGLARSVRDFDAFLEDNVSMEWDSQRKKIYQHFGIKPREDLAATGKGSFIALASKDNSGGFGRSRKSKAAALASSRGNGPSGESTFGRSSMARSAIGAASAAGKPTRPAFADMEKQTEKNGATTLTPSDRFQRDKQNKYAEKVQALNVARMDKLPYPLCQLLSSVVTQACEQHGPDLVKAYRALADIVSENPDVESLTDPAAVNERQFAKGYLDENPNSASSIEVKRKILRGGTRCLERLAFEEVESLISKNPREANLGGIPNVLSKVKAYVRLLASKKSLAGDNTDLQMLGDDYVWAVIYYLLRTGHIKEIVDYIGENHVPFRAIDRSFTSYVSQYSSNPDRRLSRELQDRINNEYNQRLRIAPENSIDPYRMACYKVIGRCDLKSRSIEGINHTVEDFVWLQLVLARETSRTEELATEAYGLRDLQKTMQEIGNRFFEKGGSDIGCSYGTFVFFQVACGMFEQAVTYLYPFSYTDAVHLAIAMDFYGFLRVSDPNTAGEDLLSWTTRENPQVNFGRMIAYYTRDFRAGNVAAAVDYLALLCLNQDIPGQGGTSQVTLCHDALRELVLESREFALLLGDLRSTGERQKGLVEERTSLIGLSEADDFMKMITIQAASAADDNGRTTDAVLLYHLASEFDTVLNIINRTLGEYLAVPLGQQPLRLQPLKPNTNPDDKSIREGAISLTAIDDPVQLSKAMTSVYASAAFKVNASVSRLNKIMIDIHNVQLQVEAQQWIRVLDGLSALEILPVNARGDSNRIRRLVAKFASLSPCVTATLPNLLAWALMSISHARTNFIASQFTGNDAARQELLRDLKQSTLDLTTYTSQLRYRFPAHLHEALARAQSEW
ncbi:Nup93/Nic96-domain-containing protein [Amylocarpus encephaloides]|uniref:Nup93/Nic96-domain-containing protein n=1 Tax=Amylocarpus encephaloides TaxID=45428 RepID=A0A9P7YNR7_9HELO|nr:Nup93/Nic96-domain-containing protein [Amylocarpus encephaloides]